MFSKHRPSGGGGGGNCGGKEKKDKSCNFFKFVLVLLFASVERVGVSRMWDFFSLPTSLATVTGPAPLCTVGWLTKTIP